MVAHSLEENNGVTHSATGHEAALPLRHAPGFFATRLHESVDPQAKYRFVKVAQWEYPQHFQAAMRTEAFQQIRAAMPFPTYPALYRVITV